MTRIATVLWSIRIFTKFGLYNLNPDMTDNIKILKELKVHLKKYLGNEIKEVILFGSRISDKAEIDSDYDILIILREKPDWPKRRVISDLCYDIALKYNIITDTHLLAESEMNSIRGRQPIFRKAIKNGIYA
jgi:predicted nucleotidyltransferase